jgi:hypothetical protein
LTLVDQQRSARTAGIALLVICASAVFSNDLIVAGDALATATNLRAHERWFRIGIVGEFVMLNADIVLAVALYLLLAPVHRPLALLGSLWRLANAGLLAVGVVANLVALDCVTDLAGTSLPLQAPVMKLWLDVHATAETVGLIFFGLGAGIHSYLLYRSRYIPRALSGAYLLVTTLLCIFCVGILLIPAVQGIVVPWIIAPDFFVEVAVALWLTIKGISSSAATPEKSYGEA